MRVKEATTLVVIPSTLTSFTDCDPHGHDTGGPPAQDAVIDKKNYYLKWESIARCLLSRQVCFLAFEARGIEPMPLAFKASVVSLAPVVLHSTSSASKL
jgi:hypothetical protein